MEIRILVRVLSKSHFHLNIALIVIEMVRMVQLELAAVLVYALGARCLIKSAEFTTKGQITLLLGIELHSFLAGHLTNTVDAALNLLLIRSLLELSLAILSLLPDFIILPTIPDITFGEADLLENQKVTIHMLTVQEWILFHHILLWHLDEVQALIILIFKQ